jgi:hypothetical protein
LQSKEDQWVKKFQKTFHALGKLWNHVFSVSEMVFLKHYRIWLRLKECGKISVVFMDKWIIINHSLFLRDYYQDFLKRRIAIC